MSSAPIEIQRLALVGYRSDVEAFIAKTQNVRSYIPRLTTGTTAIATLSAMLEQLDELSADDVGAQRRASARAAPTSLQAEPQAVDRPRRGRPPSRSATAAHQAKPTQARKATHQAKPTTSEARPLAGAAIGGKRQAWEIGRDTLTMLSMSLEGVELKDAQQQMSTGTKLLKIDTVRWRLDALVRRRQAILLRKKPRTYKITELGKQALDEDKDLRKEDRDIRL